MDINIFESREKKTSVRIISDVPVLGRLVWATLSSDFLVVDRKADLTVIVSDDLTVTEKGACIYVGDKKRTLLPRQIQLSRPLSVEALYESAVALTKAGEITGAGFAFNPEISCVTYNGASSRLTEKEKALFLLLLSRVGECVSREEIERALWGGEAVGNAADVYVCHLRKKLEGIAGPGVLLSVRGRGYMLKNIK